MQIPCIKGKCFAVPWPSLVVNHAAVFPIEEGTAEHQGAAFAALLAVSLSRLKLPGNIFFFHIIVVNSSHFAFQIPNSHFPCPVILGQLPFEQHNGHTGNYMIAFMRQPVQFFAYP
jgi:hypothetical protein